MKIDSELPPTTPASVRPGVVGSRRRSALIAASVLALLVSAGMWFLLRSPATAPGGGPGKGSGRVDANRPMPVLVATTHTVDLPVRLDALGTVTASNTAVVRARVDGQLVRVNFREGDIVRAGQVLAEIDPRPFAVQLTQAEGQLAKDRALLVNAQNDLARYRSLLAQDSIAAQQVDNQDNLVRQYQGVVAADEGAVASAKLQLSFTRVSAPIRGRAGLRQVDAGNLVRASDAGGIVVITQVQPITVVFPLPQDDLPAVQARLARGARLAVEAYDREGRVKLASGTVLTTDNVIDATTGTVRVKAQFANADGALFPNQFVNVRLTVDTITGALVVPGAAIQRGAPGTYVYVVKADNTASVRAVTLGAGDGRQVAITQGLSAGERVVIDGADKLREGAPVLVIDPAARAPAATGATPRAGRRGQDGKTSAQ